MYLRMNLLLLTVSTINSMYFLSSKVLIEIYMGTNRDAIRYNRGIVEHVSMLSTHLSKS